MICSLLLFMTLQSSVELWSPAPRPQMANPQKEKEDTDLGTDWNANLTCVCLVRSVLWNVYNLTLQEVLVTCECKRFVDGRFCSHERVNSVCIPKTLVIAVKHRDMERSKTSKPHFCDNDTFCIVPVFRCCIIHKFIQTTHIHSSFLLKHNSLSQPHRSHWLTNHNVDSTLDPVYFSQYLLSDIVLNHPPPLWQRDLATLLKYKEASMKVLFNNCTNLVRYDIKFYHKETHS